jgi:tRNA (mo5U34)-methyltransferase
MSSAPELPEKAGQPALSDADLRKLITGRQWYHTVRLRPGIETEGWFDTRAAARKFPWPDLSGKRCLDVGTFDGYWAFEMERRGAGEVVAIDILDPKQWDWPYGSTEAVREALSERKDGGDGFAICAAELRSRVRREERSVYDVGPDMGTFDFIYVGSLLLHLRDPVRALEKVRAVCRPNGYVLVVDAIDVDLSLVSPRSPSARLDGLGRPWWFKPNLAGLRRMAQSAGLDVVSGPRPFAMRRGLGQPAAGKWPRLHGPLGREQVITRLWGDPHAWLLTVPRP